MASASASNSSVKCVYCGEQHFSVSCLKIRSAREHKAVLLRSGRCFNCLKTNHKSKECNSSRTCRHCGRKNHQSICESNDPPSANKGHDRSNEVGALPQNVANGGHNEQNKGTVTTNSASLVKNQQTVLLQTAHALASANPGGSTVCVRILFDSGSQLSYVTERLRAQLGLRQTRIEKLHLNTFGNDG